jgi:hypothetical protein
LVPAGVAWNSALTRLHLNAFTMNRYGTSFEAISGGREALEREYMWAILFDRPDKHSLARRLEPSANDALSVVLPGSTEQEAPRRSGERPA